MTTFTVWVGGIPDVEGVDHDTAIAVRDEWIEQGYDDVVVEQDPSDKETTHE